MMAANAPLADGAPPVPVGIDLGSLHARLAVTDALHLTDVSSGTSGGGSSAQQGGNLPEPRVVSNAQGARYTLAASTLDVTHPPIDEYSGDGNGSNGNAQNEEPQQEVQFIFGDAARKALTRQKQPLGQSLVRQLSVLSICGSVDWTTDDEGDVAMMDKEPEPEPAPPAVEETAGANKTAAQASAAFFANLANLACDATSAHPAQLRAVVSVPAGADRRTIRGVVDSAERGLDEAIAQSQGKEKEKGKQNGGGSGKKKGKKKGKQHDGGKVVGVLTDPAAVCLAHGLADATTASTINLGSNSSPPGPSNWRHALVVDWGASGLTLSHVARMGSSHVLSVVSTAHDAALSGRTLTDLLVAHCASQFERKCRVSGVLESKKSRARLEAACEIAIRTLGRATSCHVTVDGLYEGMDLNVPVSRPRFDMLCGPSLRKAEAQVKAVKEALAGSGEEGAALDVVLLAGNVSLMPSVKSMIDRVFPVAASEDGTPVAWRGRTDIPPDEAVAMGCAKHAAALVDPNRPTPPPETGGDRRRFWRQEAVVTSPVSIGICTWGDDSKKCPPVALIEVGTPLPAFASKKIAWNEGEDATLGIVQMVKGGDGSCQEKLLGRINDISSGAELALGLTKEGKLSVSIDGGENVTL